MSEDHNQLDAPDQEAVVELSSPEETPLDVWALMRQGDPVGPGVWPGEAQSGLDVPDAPRYVPSGWLALPVALLGFLLATVLGLILTAVYLVFNHAGLSLDDPQALESELLGDTGVVVVSSVGLWLGFLATCWVWSAKLMHEKFLDFYALRRVAVKTLLYGVAAGLVLRAIATAAGVFIPTQEVNGRDYSNNTDVITEAVGDPARMLAVTLFVVVGAPVFEELFFRGLIFSSLARSTKLWIAIAASSALFGVVHYQGGGSAGLALLLVTGVAGAGLAWVRYKTGSLLSGILAHSTFNAVAIVLVFVFGQSG